MEEAERVPLSCKVNCLARSTAILTYHGTGGTGPVEGSTGWYLVVLGQYGEEQVDT